MKILILRRLIKIKIKRSPQKMKYLKRKKSKKMKKFPFLE